MFVRTKKIKGQDYAYLVQNSWTKKGTRQKVKGYLGRVFPFDVEKNVQFQVKDTQSPKETVINLIKWELERRNFKEDNNILRRDNISVNLNTLEVKNSKRNAVLKLNNGFICPHTLNNLLTFKSYGEADEVAVELATIFSDAGIEIPQEIFINLYQKVFNKKQSKI